VRPRAALRRGQLSIAAVAAALLAPGPANAATMLEVLAGRRAQAVYEGYPALRVTADMSWAIRPSAAGEELVAFETAVGRSFADGRLLMLCQYDRAASTP
jgi:hypothetical protein